MQDIVQHLAAAIHAHQRLAYCRLVETRGSTPQKAGALMLVFADGSQVGTLGGGCVEAEVKHRAGLTLQAGQPEIHAFNLNSDYGWDDGLICGGRMQVLIHPIADPSAADYFLQLAAAVSQGAGITEAVVFDAGAPGPSSAPGLILCDARGDLLASWGPVDERIFATVQLALRPLAERPRPYATPGFAFLPVLPRCRLLIVGGGHVGQAVANLAYDLEFDVCIVDDRADFASRERFPRAQQRLHGDLQQILTQFPITPHTYCLIVTRGHHHDERALACLADRGAAYVGMIGSRRKIRMIFEDLIAAGTSPQALQQVHAPVGIEIGSQTVPEIALSICAELVAFRNCQGVVPGRPATVDLHA